MLLSSQLAHIDFLDEHISRLDHEIEERMRPFEEEINLLDGETFFAVTLNLATCQYEVEEMRCAYEEMTSVINYAILNNPEMVKVLKRRYSEMKTAGREIIKKHGQTAKPQLKTVTVGRNDPCPCGSGKKYKNCCQK